MGEAARVSGMLRPGQCVGDTGILFNGVRGRTVTAVTACVLYGVEVLPLWVCEVEIPDPSGTVLGGGSHPGTECDHKA